MIKHQQLTGELKRGVIRPLYLLYGEEDFLIQEAVDLAVRKGVDPAAKDFNFASVYCRETPAADLVALCLTLPFMAERRVVVAKDLDAYKSGDLDDLIAYLQSPSPSTCLIMTVHQRRYDKKTVLAPVEAAGAVSVFYALTEGEVPAWIEGKVRERGLSIEKDAVRYIAQIIGNDLQKITGELDKTAIFLNNRKAITFDDVKTVVGDFREFTSFDLAEAIGRKSAERAFLILNRLIQEGEQPVAILGSIAWNFRRLLRAKVLELAGTGYEEIKRKLNVIFHQSLSFRDQMRSYTEKELRGVFSVMAAADRRLKSSGISGKLVLERMILRLCGAAGR